MRRNTSKRYWFQRKRRKGVRLSAGDKKREKAKTLRGSRRDERKAGRDTARRSLLIALPCNFITS